MSSVSEPTTRRIAQAALVLIERHGFRRTSMAEVARAAGVSRATLYLAFPDKAALFQHLASTVAEDAIAAAEAAWREDAALAENLEAAILAKDGPLFRLLHASPHGAELLAVDAELTRAHAERLDAAFASLLARRARRLDGADLAAFGGAAGFGRFLATAGAGLKHEVRTEADHVRAVRALAKVAARAALPTHAPKEITP